MEYLKITAETLFGFSALFILTKVLGKTQITQITAFDFIAALVLGELVGNALYDEKIGILDIGYAILLWGVLIYTTEIITEKFKGTRALLEGRPALVIRKGKIDRAALKKSKLDLNQLQHLLRSKDVFSLLEVEYAVLETDGTISVLKKAPYQSATRMDINKPPVAVPLPMAIISDGEILWDNLEEANLDEQWLLKELEKQGIMTAKEVMYAEYNSETNQLSIMPLHPINYKKSSDGQ